MEGSGVKDSKLQNSNITCSMAKVTNQAARVKVPAGSGILIFPKTGCVLCFLSYVSSGGGPVILLTTDSRKPALVLLCVVVHNHRPYRTTTCRERN